MGAMQVKPKKCRGTGFAKGSGCGKKKIIKAYGLCPNCYREWLFNTDEGNKVVKRTAITSVAKIEKKKKKEARIKKRG